MVQEIIVYPGKKSLVDDSDYEIINKHKWSLHKWWGKEYPRTHITIDGVKTIRRLHQFLIKVDKGLEIDHINGNGLDNRRENLRIVTHKQNLMNQKKQTRNTTSKYKGVYWHKLTKKWTVGIKINQKEFIFMDLNLKTKQHNTIMMSLELCLVNMLD